MVLAVFRQCLLETTDEDEKLDPHHCRCDVMEKGRLSAELRVNCRQRSDAILLDEFVYLSVAIGKG